MSPGLKNSINLKKRRKKKFLFMSFFLNCSFSNCGNVLFSLLVLRLYDKNYKLKFEFQDVVEKLHWKKCLFSSDNEHVIGGKSFLIRYDAIHSSFNCLSLPNCVHKLDRCSKGAKSN